MSLVLKDQSPFRRLVSGCATFEGDMFYSKVAPGARLCCYAFYKQTVKCMCV